MPQGFFPSSRLHSKPPPSSIMKCGACGLYKTCRSPKMEVSGEGKRRILVVAEAPGAEEDEQGIQLVGKAGKELQRHLRAVGVDMRKDCWLENAIICRPPKNRTPTSEEINYCRPHLVKTIEDLSPHVIIPLGASAVQSVLRSFWREDVGPITRWVGWQIPCQRLNAWVCPTYHPSFLLRSMRKEFGRDGNPVLNRMFRQHLQAAAKLKGRPFKEVPDYRRQIECVADTSRAAEILDWMFAKGGRFVFDYETTVLKPESGGSIVCCSVCWEGKRTVAYPWQGRAIHATKRILHSRHPKIGWNIKFEDRWTRHEFGKPVRNWIWDGMVNAHVLDNRQGICSAKFQAFVTLGTEAYNEHVEEFLRSKKGQRINQILSEVDLKDLLYYCGFDSLLEFQIAMVQMKQMGYEARN